VFPPEWKGSYTQEVLFKILEDHPNPRALAASLDRAVRELETRLPHRDTWRWGVAHTLVLRHPLGESKFNLPPIPRGGDSTTVNASGRQGGTGASWREILDVADWDRSVMTNVPGESGDPESKHYRDLLDDWIAGRYHPLPFSRKAVEAAMEERIVLEPK
jgi:penicillin amidase